jgi:hypothetical protein
MFPHAPDVAGLGAVSALSSTPRAWAARGVHKLGRLAV